MRRKKEKRKHLLGLFLLFIFLSSSYFGVFFISNVSGSVQDEDYSIESDFNVFENLPYTYSGTFYESTDYKYAFQSAKIQFQFEDFGVDDEYVVTDNLTNSESKQAYGEQNFTFTDGHGSEFDNLMTEDLVYSYFNYTGIGLYNATYSFTEELEGTSGDSIDFIDTIGATTTANIIGELDGHNKILSMTDSVDYRHNYNYFSDQSTGTVEFWVRAEQTNLRCMIYLFDGVGGFLMVEFYEDGNIYYYDSGHIDTGFTYLVDQWYHFRIEFDCSNDWHLWIDGVSIDAGIGYTYHAIPVTFDNMDIRIETSGIFYFDAIDYSWSPSYEEGRNREENWVPIDFDATYSFDGDAIGSVPSGWTEAVDSTVAHAFNKHNQVIEMERVGSNTIISQTFTDPDQTSGTIEFYFGSNDVTRLSHMRLYDGSTIAISINFGSDDIQYYSGGYNSIIDAKDNIMYHIRIDFECGAGAYKGLAADTFYIYIDGVKFGAYTFNVAVNHLDKLYFIGNSGNVYNTYIDAVGYSWDTGYDIGDNVIFTPSIIDNFPATYDFYKQPIWTQDEDIDYVNHINPNNYVEIVPEYQDHRKVLHYYSGIAGSFYNDFESTQSSGTIEFYNKEIVNRNYWMLQYDGTASYAAMVIIYTTSARFYYWDGSANVYSSHVYTTDFPHFKIEFNCDTDTYSGWCEGVLVVNNVPFYNNIDANNVYRISHYNSGAFEFYMDAVGYSWDEHYLIGDNLNDNFYLGYENFEGYNRTEYGNYFGTYSFDDIKTEEGVHYGTYDFRDDVDGSNPTGWVDSSGGVTHAYVISDKEDHIKVLELYDNDVTNYAHIENSFSTQSNSTFEFWWSFNSDQGWAEYLKVSLQEGGSTRISLRLNYLGVGFLTNDDGGGAVTFKTGCTIDTWYHFKLILNDFANTFDIYVDGVLEGDDLGYYSNSTVGINKVGLTTRSDAGLDYYHWIDAIGYSFDTTSHSGLGYEIGYNINDYDIEPLLQSYFNFNIHYGMNVSIEAYYDFHNFVLKINDYYYSMTNYYEGVEDFDNYLVYTILGDYEGTESFDYTTLADYYYGTYDWRDLSTPAETFYGTYDFRDELGESGTSISYVDAAYGSGTITVVATESGHSNVIENKDSASSGTGFYHHFSNRDNGTIEYWFLTDDNTENTELMLRESGAIIINFQMIAGHFHYGGNLVACANNTWYHVKLQWYADETVDIWIDEVKYIDGVANSNPWVSGLTSTWHRIYSDGTSIYIDAVGESWDITSHSGLGYTVDYNKISYDIEPILETGMELDNIVIGDYCTVVNPFNNHKYSLKLYGNESATLGGSGNLLSPAQFGDFVFTKGSGGASGELETNNGVNYARIDAGTTTGTESYLGYIEPSADTTTNWNEADAIPHWSKIYESDGTDVSADGGNIRETTAGVDDRWEFTDLTLPANSHVSKLEVRMNVKHGATATPRTTVKMTSNVGASGYYGGGNDVYAWSGDTTTGLSLSEAQLDALYINVEPYNLPTGDYCWVDIECVYIKVYTTTNTQYSMDYYATIDVDDAVTIDYFRYDYRTTLAIDCDLDIYNWDTTGWLELQSNTGVGFITGSHAPTDPYISATNQVRVRFQTPLTYTDFDMELDQIAVDFDNTTFNEDARSFSAYDTFLKSNGIIEFWAFFYDAPYVNQIIFNNDTQIYLSDDGGCYWYNGTETLITSGFEHSEWSHWKIDWSGNDVDVYINGTLELSTFWAGGAVTLDRIDFMSFEDSAFYIDAIGYNWSAYDFWEDNVATYSNGEEASVVSNIDYADECTIGTNDGTVDILALEDGQRKVLKLTNAGASTVYVKNSFSAKTIETVEYWVKGVYGRFYIGGVGGTHINVENRQATNLIYFWHGDGLGGSTFTSIAWIAPWSWAHIKITFDTDTDTWSGWVNGVNVVTDVPFLSDLTSTGMTYTQCTLESGNSEGFYDEISYSWMTDTSSHSGLGYELGWNINPYDIIPLLTAGLSLDIYIDTYFKVDDISGHTNSFVFYDNSATEDLLFYDEFSSGQSSGVIEMWIRTTDSTEFFVIHISDGEWSPSKTAVDIGINGGKFQYYDGAWNDVAPCVNNVWYHVKIDFDCGTDTFDFYINGTLEGNDLDFWNVKTTVNRITVFSVNSQPTVYFDAFGYDWDGYIEWDNCNPYGVLTDMDDNWVINYRPYTAINILDELDFHYHVLNMTSWNGAVTESVEYTFTDQNYGTIDFWMKTNNIGYRSMLQLYEGGSSRSWFYLQSSKFQYYDGAVKDVPNVGIPIVDTWHHITIHFCLDASGYANLGADQIRFVIDGIDSGVLNLASVATNINKIIISTANNNGGNKHSTYFDAFDFSWDASYIHPAHNEIPFGSSYGSNFTVSSDETIEMWISGNFSNYFRTYFYESNNVVFAIKFDEDYFYYTDMGVWIKECWVVSDWTHLKIYFEASTNTYDITINGTSIATNIDSHIAFTTIDEWTYETEYYVNSTFYIDAIGYEWDSNYDVGDNINPHGKAVLVAMEAEGYSFSNYPLNSIGISGEFNSYSKFINMTDGSSTFGDYVFTDTFSETSGTIEFYFKQSDYNKISYFSLRTSVWPNVIGILRIDGGGLLKWAGDIQTTIGSYVADVWYHIRIDFECGNGEYMGLSADTVDIYIDGILSGKGLGFDTPTDTLYQITLTTHTTQYDYSVYFDAIHYSWEDTNVYFNGYHSQHCDIEAVIDFTVEIPFYNYDKKILWIDIESVHFTNTLTNVSFNYYNQTSSSWYELNNTVNTSPTSHNPIFHANTLQGFFNGSGIFLLKFYMYNHSDFWFKDDLINVTIWYKTELNYEHTLEWIGSWRYRFLLDVGLASSWNSSWIIFDVVAQPPNFEGISESRYSTRWVLTSTETTGILGLVYEDGLTSGYWDLSDFSSRTFSKTVDPEHDSYVSSSNPTFNYGSDSDLWVCELTNTRIIYLGFPTLNYLYENSTNAYSQIYLEQRTAWESSTSGLFHQTGSFDESTIIWNNKPIDVSLLNTLNLAQGGNWYSLNTHTPYQYYSIHSDNQGSGDGYYQFYSYEWTTRYPKLNALINKHYHNTSGGYAYMQASSTETLGLISSQSSDTSLSEGDIFTVDLQTTSSNALLKLYNGGILQSTFNLLTANTEFGRQEVEVYVSEDVVYDQVKITSELDDAEYLKLYDIKAEHWTFAVGEEQDLMFVEPFGQNELIIDNLGNCSLKIYENDILQIDTYVTISYDLLTYVYESPIAETVFITFYDSNHEYLDFNDFVTYVNYTLYEVDYGDQRLTNREFYVDELTNIYFDIYDSFNASVYSNTRLAATLIDITLPVYELKIKNEALEQVSYSLESNSTAITKTGYIFPEEIIKFSIATGNYSLDYINYEDMYPREYNFELTDHKTITINTTYHTVYIGLFTYDGLGLNRDWVRLYINDVRADFGFNVIQSETANLTVLDYFNNTLASVIIDASAWSEYNLYAQVYSMYILNQFTYNDLIVNITQVGSGMWMNQLIPSASALLYRFIPNINYTINVTYVNGTVYSIRTVNLTDNSQIESFGVPSAPSEYPKDVYFGIYTTTGLGIDHDLLRFYIDGNRTNFGFNWITNEIVTVVVKDYFNTTLFNQMVNTSGIYEYNILITLHSLKVKNEARVSTNYTLNYGALETTGYILPEEIIEYQLSSNNYVFDYTNNEDGSSGTININLNQDRVYILNSTYYDIYFSLFDINLHNINPHEYEFRLNGTLHDLGLVEDLSTNNYTITITDRFGTSLFNSITTLRGLNEYRINISLYELQVRHLAMENGNMSLYETILHNSFNFSMASDTIKSFILGSSTYNITWLNNENGITTIYNINLNSDYILTLNSSYYSVYIGLYNFYGIVNPEEVKFYINGTRADFGFNTIKSEYVNLTVLDYFDSTLFSQVVRLEGLTEYSIFIRAYTMVVNNLYKNQTITIEITRGNITIERLIEAQGWTEFKLFPNIEYEVFSYIDGVKDEERDVKLTEEYMVVDFGFYETEVPIVPRPLEADFLTFVAFVVILAVMCVIVVFAWSYMKKERDVVPKKVQYLYKNKEWKAGTFKDEGI